MSRTVKQILSNWSYYGTIDNQDGGAIIRAYEELVKKSAENNEAVNKLLVENKGLKSKARALTRLNEKLTEKEKEKENGEEKIEPKHRGGGTQPDTTEDQ